MGPRQSPAEALAAMRAEQAWNAQQMAQGQIAAMRHHHASVIPQILQLLVQEGVRPEPVYIAGPEKRISDSWGGGIRIRTVYTDTHTDGVLLTSSPAVVVTTQSRVYTPGGSGRAESTKWNKARGLGRGPGWAVSTDMTHLEYALGAPGKPLRAVDIARLVDATLRR